MAQTAAADDEAYIPDPDVRLAYARLFADNPKKGDAALVIADLAHFCGFYGVPSIAAWLKQGGQTAAYPVAMHELHGKRAVFARVSNYATLPEHTLVRLEQFVRFGAARSDEE